MITSIKKTLLLCSGSLCVLLGLIGIVLPLVPTTPFLLLAAWCYAKSSQKLYDRLLHTKWLGTYIHQYRTQRALPLKTKWTALLVLWGSAFYSIFFLVPLVIIQIFLTGVVLYISYFIFSLKTLR
ncbi:YbaN family protein [Salibacterium halotolerans]|uniref:Inner membrane protein n=1 Tax=Salibacterium halotolerans TaxID=1884432 RepID=A0A1I5RSS7_9BACI|nr:YbaN family protein [Salibacterium halotolerans]SFP61584.1 hypothetical protein SAMN05518683_107158 [Salibacterium halotolerans]